MMTPHGVQDYSNSSAGIKDSGFLFVTCQHGTESTLKKFLVAPESPFRLAFSKPGFLSFKVVLPTSIPKHPLIRRVGWVIGQVSGPEAKEMMQQAVQLAGNKWNGIHVFQRDTYDTGFMGFEPGISTLSQEIGEIFGQQLEHRLPINEIAKIGDNVMDVVIVEPDRWVIGSHQADEVSDSWPGGVFPVSEPPEMISRAYLKMAEAIAWSRLPFSPGNQVVEIGSSPGGAAQRLLDMGLTVTGVDPAEMDPLLLEHPRFEHWRAKSSAVKRKNYRKFKWLVADANVAPNYTLDCVGDIVNYPTSKIQGLILTLKLSSYELLDHLEDYLERIRSWGFARVEARQLGHNRRELCVVAARKS
jgi:23S rRNA (cytidine2498-2'-O)-methyltransferase